MDGQPLSEPADTTPDAEVCGEVEALASTAFGRTVSVQGWAKLNGRPDSIRVARVGICDPAGRAVSVVAKYRPRRGPAILDGDARNFDEETFAYRFLMTFREEFPFFPRLLGLGDGLILLEDLGPDTYVFPSEEAVNTALARLFSRLHRVTADREAAYDDARHRWGYPPADEDRRPFGPRGSVGAFTVGCRELLRWSGILQPASTATLVEMVREAERTIRDPGPFRAFVHDDLSNRRQSVVRDGEFHLLDFEYSKYFHALTDLAKLMIGKIERRIVGRQYVHMHPSVSHGMAAAYRQAWRDAGGPTVADAVWERHLAAALTFQAMVAIAQIHGVINQGFAATVPATIRSVLQRLILQLRPITAGRPLADVLEPLQARILG